MICTSCNDGTAVNCPDSDCESGSMCWECLRTILGTSDCFCPVCGVTWPEEFILSIDIDMAYSDARDGKRLFELHTSYNVSDQHLSIYKICTKLSEAVTDEDSDELRNTPYYVLYKMFDDIIETTCLACKELKETCDACDWRALPDVIVPTADFPGKKGLIGLLTHIKESSLLYNVTYSCYNYNTMRSRLEYELGITDKNEFICQLMSHNNLMLKSDKYMKARRALYHTLSALVSEVSGNANNDELIIARALAAVFTHNNTPVARYGYREVLDVVSVFIDRKFDMTPVVDYDDNDDDFNEVFLMLSGSSNLWRSMCGVEGDSSSIRVPEKSS